MNRRTANEYLYTAISMRLIKSLLLATNFGFVAPKVERRFEEPRVIGSSPIKAIHASIPIGREIGLRFLIVWVRIPSSVFNNLNQPLKFMRLNAPLVWERQRVRIPLVALKFLRLSYNGLLPLASNQITGVRIPLAALEEMRNSKVAHRDSIPGSLNRKTPLIGLTR